jgi:hypothetical protein
VNNAKDYTTMAQEQYIIRVKGHLGQQWNEWFDGFTITLSEYHIESCKSASLKVVYQVGEKA